jgi:hypothetical protein
VAAVAGAFSQALSYLVPAGNNPVYRAHPSSDSGEPNCLHI